MKKIMQKKSFLNYLGNYFDGISKVISLLDTKEIEKSSLLLQKIKTERGRLFLLGVGGSAANCSHIVNDLRKICHIDSYTPTDNVAELTARTNDDGWQNSFVDWLKVCRLTSKDGIIVLSVGGGNKKTKTSINIINALDYAKSKKVPVIGIVSRDGGYTKQVANICIHIPTLNSNLITAYAETFQLLLFHALVNYPLLRK